MSLNLLLVFVPVAWGLDWFEAAPALVFICSGLAIIPLAGLMGQATDRIADFIGPSLGGLLAATMGNAPELILSIFALKAGLYDVVKAAITGSIVGNLLLGLGLAIFLGGIDKEKLQFNRIAAGISSGLLLLACVGLIVPAISHFSSNQETEISTEIAVVLFVAYLLSLVFTLKTHRHLFEDQADDAAVESRPGNADDGKWSKNKAIGILVIVSVGIAFMSESLTGAIEPAAESLHLTQIFAGVIFLSFFGNASDLMNAVRFAKEDKMELSMGIAVGASTQVVLFVVPVLVFTSYWVGPRPLDLLFVPFEVAAIVMAVLINRSLTSDGETHWMEGVMLLGVYLILAIGFFFLPA